MGLSYCMNRKKNLGYHLANDKGNTVIKSKFLFCHLYALFIRLLNLLKSQTVHFITHLLPKTFTLCVISYSLYKHSLP